MGNEDQPAGEYLSRLAYCLVVGLPDGGTVRHDVGQSPILVGRSADCDIRLDELNVSRQHCLFHQRAARLVVIDQDSTHGTLLNDTLVHQAQLRHGDVVRVGSTEIRVEARGTGGRTDTPVSKAHPLAAIRLVQSLRQTAAPKAEAGTPLGLVYRLGGLLAHSVDMPAAAEAVLDLVLEAFPVDRALVILAPSPGTECGPPKPFARKHREDAEAFEGNPSETVVGRVLATGRALHSLDVPGDRRLKRSESLIGLGVRVVLCAPLRHGDEVLGLLYADARAGPTAPDEEQLPLFEALADQAALALGRARLHTELVSKHELIREQRDQLDALTRSLERRVAEKTALAEERAIALAERLAELEQLQAARETMAQCLVHDVKNLVAAIDLSLQYLGLVVRGNERAEQATQDAQEVGGRILGLVEDVLAVSRMESGAMALAPKLVSVAALFSAAVRRNSAVARDRNVELALARVEPGLALVVDPGLTERVLDNLIGNGVRYAGEGGAVRLGARLVDTVIEIAIADTGPGIPEAERRLVFDKWYQSVGRGSRHHGLGLHFCQLAVEAHGGTIRIEGEPGRNVLVVSVPARADLDEDVTM